MPFDKNHIRDALSVIDCFDISASDDALSELAKRVAGINDEQKDQYQTAWSNRAMRLERANEESNDLAECLAQATGVPASNGLIISGIAHDQMKIDRQSFVPKSNHMVIAHDGQYKLTLNSAADPRLAEAICNALTDKTQAVIELGAGWGRNLASVALRTPRRDIDFVGMEQATDGLRCMAMLLSKDPNVRSTTTYYDFYDPDYALLEEYEDIVVFTSAAIEQIVFIGASFIDDIMAIAKRVTLIFYEPIGWQRDDNLQRFGLQTTLAEIMGTVPAEKQHLLNYTFVLDDRAMETNAVSWSVCGKYNLNLWSVIHDAISRGIARPKLEQFNIFGLNPFNPYSLIVLEKRK